MADTQILRPETVDAPFEYSVPSQAEIGLKAVSAFIDGSGAAGAFLPVLVVESDAGEIVAESDAPEVAAGSSVRANWFPFVGGASGVTPPPSLSGLSWAFQASPSHVTVPTQTDKAVAPTTPTGFFTNDTSLFAQGTGKVLGDPTTYYGIRFTGAAGFYLTWASFSPFTTIPAGVDYAVSIGNGNNPDETGLLLAPSRRTSLGGTEDQDLEWISLGTLDSGPMSHAMIFTVNNYDTTNTFTAFLQVLVICLDPNQSTYVG